jgi:hypothetical protein
MEVKMRSIPLLATAFALTALVAGTASAQLTQQQQAQQMQQQQMQQQQMPASTTPKTWPAPANNAPAAGYVNAPAGAPNGQFPAPSGAPVTPSAQIDSTGGGAIPALPMQVKTSGGVTYLSGGISDEELSQLKSQESLYNVQVLLSAKNGEYVSNIALRILDNKSTPLVSIVDAGPYVYAKMLPGTYYLETAVKSTGVVKKESFKVTSKGVVKKHVVFE